MTGFPLFGYGEKPHRQLLNDRLRYRELAVRIHFEALHMMNVFTSKSLNPRDFRGKRDNFGLWLSVLFAVPVTALFSLTRKFGQDEFEAIKSAWKIFSGERIYVDFFQHHHPLLYYLLSPLFSMMGESIAVILLARCIQFLFACGIVLTSYEMAKLLFNKQVALFTVICLYATTLFVNKVIEIRPDVPETFFGLLSIFLLFKYFTSHRTHHLILSALSLALSFLFLQKILVLALMLHLLLAWRVFKKQLDFDALLLFSFVFLGTWLIYCAYLVLTDRFSQYFFFNFPFNWAKLKQHHHLINEMTKHLTSEFNALVLFPVFLFPWIPKNQAQREFAFLALVLLTFSLLYRTQYAHYYLPVLPLLAILAACGWLHLAKQHPFFVRLALAGFFFGASAIYLIHASKENNAPQLEKIAYVYHLTGSQDYVYDGNIMFNVFRKDLDFFWFSVGRFHSLDKYKSLRDYDYDIYSLIDRFKPKVISDYSIEDMQNPVIRNHYTVSARYPDIYLRNDISAGTPVMNRVAPSATAKP